MEAHESKFKGNGGKKSKTDHVRQWAFDIDIRVDPAMPHNH